MIICKFWLDPIELATNHGFTTRELNQIRAIIQEELNKIQEAWSEHCAPLRRRPSIEAGHELAARITPFGLLARSGAFQPLDVGQILCSAASTFVLQKVLP